MYRCTDCGKDFEFVMVVFDNHGLDAPPFERQKLCPFCKSESYTLLPDNHCKFCGARLRGRVDYCSSECKKAGEKYYREDALRKQRFSGSAIAKAINEVTEYNRLHSTSLTYGQYFALKEGGHL